MWEIYQSIFSNYSVIKLEILRKGGEHTTSLLNPDTLILTNPIKVWALERLTPLQNSSLKIGLQTLDERTLYGNFLSWSKQFNGDIGTIKPNQFTTLLISNLLQLFVGNLSKYFQ